MANLNVRIDDAVREAFDALAAARGGTTSDLLRDLIDEALGRQDTTPARGGDTTPPSLSAVQRLTLAQQYDTLGRLIRATGEQPWEAEYHENMATVLRSGFVAEYPEMFYGIAPEMSRRDCMLVHDILTMFDRLQSSLSHLSEAERAEVDEEMEHSLTFRGFDGNDTYEGRLASYAKYLIDQSKYASMAKYFDDEHERGNSHMRMLGTYNRMLSTWRPLWDAKVRSHRHYHLTVEELMQVHAAWLHPGH